jgi:serine/threonine protein kinase
MEWWKKIFSLKKMQRFSPDPERFEIQSVLKRPLDPREIWVFFAKDKSLKKFVVIKVARGQPFCERLKTECRMHKEIYDLYPEAVLEIVSFIEMQNMQILSTVYEPQGTLYQFLCNEKVKNRKIEEPMLRKFAKEILLALVPLHASGYIHRDLKLDNLILTSKQRIKLMDFGLAFKEQDHPREAMVMGTIDYLSPESILLKDPLTSKIDSWGVGVCMYELATGVTPFSHYKTDADICKAIIYNPFDELQRLEHFVFQEKRFSTHFYTFIRQLLEKDASKRPSVLEMLSHPFIDTQQSAPSKP